jgi:2-phospho-L-lactate guanylyltransferase
LDVRVTEPAGRGGTWTVVLPVKSLSVAKSRLALGPGPSIESLALAFFQDTVTAARSCTSVASVIVVTADDRIGEHARRAGCSVIDDSGHPGINAAAQWGARFASHSSGIAILVSDLPGLLPESLAEVLRLGSAHARSFLADADGTGTTMWLATAGQHVAPRFGQASRAAHRAAGDVDLIGLPGTDLTLLASARRDVDTLADLESAGLLGLGTATAAALARRARTEADD